MAKDPESKKPLAIINLNQFQKIEIDEHTVRRRLGEQPINRKRLQLLELQNGQLLILT